MDHPGLTGSQAIVRFAGHVFAGTIILLIVAVPAMIIHLLVYVATSLPDVLYILIGFRILEYVVFGIDALTFVAYLIVSAYRLLRSV
jgi:hypothetical protein